MKVAHWKKLQIVLQARISINDKTLDLNNFKVDYYNGRDTWTPADLKKADDLSRLYLFNSNLKDLIK